MQREAAVTVMQTSHYLLSVCLIVSSPLDRGVIKGEADRVTDAASLLSDQEGQLFLI